MNRIFLCVAWLGLSACDPAFPDFYAQRAAKVAETRDRLKKAVAAVDAVKEAKTNPAPCTPPVKLKLNMFPSTAYPGTGNVEALDLDEVRAAAANEKEVKGRHSSHAGNGEQALMTALSWARAPPAGAKVTKRSQQGIDAALALDYVVLFRGSPRPGEENVDMFLVDLKSSQIVCQHAFGVKADNAGTEAYEQVEVGTGHVTNSYRVGAADRMAAGLDQQMKDVLRHELGLVW